MARDVGAARHPVEKFRLLADARHDDRLAALHDLTGDAFADFEADRAGAVVEPFDRLDVQLAVAQQRHHAAHDAVMADENLQHALHRRFQVQRAGQRLADFEQRRQSSGVAGGRGGVGSGSWPRAWGLLHSWDELLSEPTNVSDLGES